MQNSQTVFEELDLQNLAFCEGTQMNDNHHFEIFEVWYNLIQLFEGVPLPKGFLLRCFASFHAAAWMTLIAVLLLKFMLSCVALQQVMLISGLKLFWSDLACAD